MSRGCWLVVVGLLAMGPSSAREWYVSPAGDEAADGLTADRPRADLVAVAAALQPGDRLFLADGVYRLRSPLQLTAAQSGTAATPTVIAALPGATPVLTGAALVDGWEPTGGGRYQAAWPGPRPALLFRAGRRQTLARYPNLDPAEPYTSGWAHVDTASPPEELLTAHSRKRVLKVRSEDAREWADPTSAEVFIFPSHEWWNNIVPVTAHHRDDRTLVLAADCSYDIIPWDRYFVRGPLEELDAPGEWAYDSTAARLHYQTDQPLAPGEIEVSLAPHVIRVEGASHIRIDGLTLTGSQRSALALVNSVDCQVVRCVVREAGDYHGHGISVSGGRRNQVLGCDVSDVGHSGVAVSGGDLKTRQAAGHLVENCAITRVGVDYKQGAGITVSGIGNTVRRNTIGWVPRFGVMWGGADLTIELNEIHHVSLETSDTGAIYGGSLSWTSGQGVMVRHNYIHDVIGRGWRAGEWRAPFYAWGIYHDWTATGTTTVGNLVVRAPRAGIMLHDGRDNLIAGNVVVDCGEGQWDAGGQIELSGWHTQHFFWQRGLNVFNWVDKYQEVAGNPAWAAVRDPATAALPDGRTMHSNRVLGNILSYRNERAFALRFRNVALEHNESDRNLVWHHGRPPRTGQRAVGRVLSENLAPNPGFETGTLGELPLGWSWHNGPPGRSTAGLSDQGSRAGQRHLRIVGVGVPENADKPTWQRHPQIRSVDIPCQPGQLYRFTAWLRAGAEGTPADLTIQSFKPDAYHLNLGHPVVVGTEWQRFEHLFVFPAEGDPGYHPELRTCYLRPTLRADDGLLEVDEVALEAVEAMPEWEAWLAAGADRNSVVADPLFVDPARDDYRLRPESPAHALGFEPVPFEQIGCYQAPTRATWPVTSVGPPAP